MLNVNCLSLPSALPDLKAMRPGNKNDYDPEFWEFQYQTYRYLERVKNDAVTSRYNGIVKNMSALTSPDRDVIPIDTFLSSWYWFRKEHQTRYELNLRGLKLPEELPTKLKHSTNYNAPFQPRHPNSGDILFRYTNREYAEEMLKEGKIRIGAASEIEKFKDDIARFDKELEKNSYLAGEHVRITTQSGQELPIIGDFRSTVRMPNYYFLCLSLDWDSSLFHDFSADCCVVIKRPDIFYDRIEKFSQKILPDWVLFDLPVEYYDPHEQLPKQRLDAGFSKDFMYAYQRERRFLWQHLGGTPAEGYKFLSIGSLEDIAEIHSL